MCYHSLPEEQICNFPYHINNADSYQLHLVNDIIWETKHDHSKWAISTEENSSMVCFSDLNRTVQQQVRGGGAVCFENKMVHDVMAEMITKTEPCG